MQLKLLGITCLPAVRLSPGDACLPFFSSHDLSLFLSLSLSVRDIYLLGRVYFRTCSVVEIVLILHLQRQASPSPTITCCAGYPLHHPLPFPERAHSSATQHDEAANVINPINSSTISVPNSCRYKIPPLLSNHKYFLPDCQSTTQYRNDDTVIITATGQPATSTAENYVTTFFGGEYKYSNRW